MKTTYKRALSLLAALALFTTLFIFAQAEADLEWEDPITNTIWYYSVESGEATITFAENVWGDVTVPETLGGYDVVAIGSPGFNDNTTIGILTLHEGIKTVAANALNGRFSGLNVPSGLTSLGNLCTTYLRFINVAPGNSAYASIDGVLFSSDEKTLLKYPGRRDVSLTPDRTYTIPAGVRSIASSAFERGNLIFTLDSPYVRAQINVVLPNSLERIESRAFYDFPFWDQPLNIPANVSYIANDAFGPAAIEYTGSITVDGGNAAYKDIDGVLCSKDGTTLIKCPRTYLTSRGAGRTFTVPSSVTTIVADALSMIDLEVLEITNKVATIGGSWQHAIEDYYVNSLSWAPWAVVVCDKGSLAQTRAQAYSINYVFPGASDPDPHGPYIDGDYYFIVQNGKATLLRNKEAIYSYGDVVTLKSPLVCTAGSYELAKLNREALYGGDGVTHAHPSAPQIKKLIVPEGVTGIGAGLFASQFHNSTATVHADVYLPDSLVSLHNDWIRSTYKGTIYCNYGVDGSNCSHAWAHGQSFPHILVDLGGVPCANYPPGHGPEPLTLAPAEQYSFANSCANFTLNEYFTKPEDFLTLRDHIKGLYPEQSAYPVLNAAQNMRYSRWGGSCYGMSVTGLLNKNHLLNRPGKLDVAGRFGAANLSDVGIPKLNQTVESTINYYHMTQTIPFIRSEYYGPRPCNGASNLAEGMEEAVMNAQDGDRMLFSYWTGAIGHTVMVHGYDEAPYGGHYLLAWDNRAPGLPEMKIFVSYNYKRCFTEFGEVITGVEFETFLNAFERIAIDQPASGSQVGPLPGVTLGITAQGGFTITGEDAEYIGFDSDAGEFPGDGAFVGGLDADFHFLVNSALDENGNPAPAPATLLFDVTGSQAYTFAGEGALDVSMLGEGVFAAARSEAADAVVIDPDAGITVLGDGAVDFEASIGVNDGVMDMVRASGTAQNEAQISLCGEGVLIEAGTGEVSLLVIYNTVDTQEITVPNDYGNLLVTGDGSGAPGGVTVLTSSKNDGDFDIDLLCEHEHDYDDVITQPTCTAQGYTTYTCDCGDSYVDDYMDALGHDWGEWEITTPATETEEGIETRACKRDGCGEAETRPVGVLPHVHDYAGVVTQPTCTAQGYTTYTCAADGASYVGGYTAVLGHDWGAWAETKPATAAEEGVETRACKRDGCGETETRAIDKLTPALKWWQKLAPWLQWILRWFCFGWSWMK